MSDTPPPSPLAPSASKEVSSIHVAVTYTDGTTEFRGFRGLQAPMSPPDSDDGRDDVADEAEEGDGALHHALQPEGQRHQRLLVVHRAVQQVGRQAATRKRQSGVVSARSICS